MSQLDLFDAPTSEAEKTAGMDAAAAAKKATLAYARKVAIRIARNREDGITADDVVEQLVREGFIFIRLATVLDRFSAVTNGNGHESDAKACARTLIAMNSRCGD